MLATIFNIFTFLLILKFNISQKTYFVSGQMADIVHDRPTISLHSCPVNVKGLNLKGEKGDKGSPGLPGKDGDPGTCKCTCPKIRFSMDPDDSGEAEDAVISCKYTEMKNEEIEVRENSPFFVKCEQNGTNIYTCLRKTNKLIFNEDNRENLAYALGDKPFWLSNRSSEHDKLSTGNGRFSLTEFYFGYDMDELEFLQEHSVFAIQKIRYHCKNTTVVPLNNPEKALQMLSWKEQLVGPVATNFHPFHYSIEEDGCKDSADSWNYTDIKLVGYHGRLPVLDFYIGDTGIGDQKLYIELLELCFG